MAKIMTDNPKGFKIIEVSAEETISWGGMGICDFCSGQPKNLFYIPVLNSCYCPECYKEWMQRAINYPEDRHYEDKKYIQMIEFLAL